MNCFFFLLDEIGAFFPNNLNEQWFFLQSLLSIDKYAHQEACLSLTSEFTNASVPQFPSIKWECWITHSSRYFLKIK